MTNQRSKYDFIVVGAGPAGCAIATRLAQTKMRPSVLLLEAGGENNDVSLRIDHNKFIQRMTESLSWGYKSTPRDSIDGRVVDLDRGKGLGGSSTINFTAWTTGSRDELDWISKTTGDDAWTWERCQQRWKSLENFHGNKKDLPEGMEKYIDPNPENHGTSGPLHVGFPSEWENDMTDMPDIWAANGYPINKDASSGDHLGVFIVPITSFRGVRATAKDLLMRSPDNIQVLPNATVHRVLFDNTKKATGVSLIDGRQFAANNEVILAAGTFGSPKILMHSGIGPEDQLSSFHIPILHNNLNVGQHYQDHCHITMRFHRAEHTSLRPAFFRSKVAQIAALQEWELYRTGPLANMGCGMTMGFFKSPAILSSEEYQNLPPVERERLALPTVPSYEVSSGPVAIDHYIRPDTTPAVSCIFVFVHNSQGKGCVRLQSADPNVPFLFDSSFLDHPYDKRVAIEGTRETLKVIQSAKFQKDNLRIISAPKSDSEEDILAFWRENTASTWHMSGTAKLGRSEKEDHAVVDTEFKVFGVQGLRVADMSVMPINPR